MTNISTTWKPKPFLLTPAGKDYLWGGTRLKAEFNKEFDMEPLAETWECSTHPEGMSVVADGLFQGMTLSEVLYRHPEYLGTHPKGELPILIKFIDAKQDLSVQVHPNDSYAFEKENGQLGKTEMWYVMDASRDAKLVYGFHHDMSKEQLRKSLDDGTIERYLQKIPVHKDDVFFIQAGTVHAIGAGALIVEIQESSNLTYRMYDYNRRDKQGRLRELHLEKALEVANRKSSAQPRQPMRLLRYTRGMASELLCRCKYFQVKRYLLDTEQTKRLVEFHTDENSFEVFLCMEGCGTLFLEDGDFLNFFKGDCIFVPAASGCIQFHGKARFLGVNC